MDDGALPKADVHFAAAMGDDGHAAPLVQRVLEKQARERGSAPYLTAIDERLREETLSFAALETLSARLAAWLGRHHGVRQGSMIALCPVNSLDSVIAIFALMRMGAVTLLISPNDPPARIAELCSTAGAELVLRSSQADPAAFGDAVAIPDIHNLDDLPFIAAEIGRWSDVFLIGTSGSTAASKIVRQSNANMAANAKSVIAHHKLRPGDRLLGCLPIHHVNGLHFTLMATLSAGSHAILLRRFDPLSYAKVLENYRPRIASVVPSILDVLASFSRTAARPADFDYFVTAAAPLSSETARAVDRAIGARIVQGYGLTETTNFSCTLPPDLSAEAYRELMLDAKIPTVGQAVCNDVAVLDRQGGECSDGTVGEIAMRGPNVMSGYWGNSAATDDAFRNGWFHSGDLGYAVRSEKGERFFVLTGRSKNIAKVRGEAVSLEEMEHALRAMDGIDDAGCIARSDRRAGEIIIAAVVTNRPMEDSAIHSHLQRTFPANAMPSRIVAMDRIPRTPTGKLLRRDLANELNALTA